MLRRNYLGINLFIHLLILSIEGFYMLLEMARIKIRMVRIRIR